LILFPHFLWVGDQFTTCFIIGNCKYFILYFLALCSCPSKMLVNSLLCFGFCQYKSIFLFRYVCNSCFAGRLNTISSNFGAIPFSISSFIKSLTISFSKSFLKFLNNLTVASLRWLYVCLPLGCQVRELVFLDCGLFWQ
jgi:hypothetical protein